MFSETEIQNITANVETEIVDELVENFLQRKKDSLLLSDSFQRLGMSEKAHRVCECGTWLQWRVHLDKLNDPRCQRLTGANFCGHVLCPCCAWRRSRKLKNQLVAIVNHLDGFRYLSLTLTVRNVRSDELLQTVDNLISTSWHKLVNSKRFKKSVAGYFRAIEITHDTNLIITSFMYKRKQKFYKRCGLNIGDANPTYDTYHPHIHVLLAVEPSYFDKDGDIYIHQQEWREMWAKALGADYDPYVDIRVVYNKNSGNKRRKREVNNAAAILEVGKYITKSNDYIIRGANNRTVDEVRTDSAVKAISTSLAGRRSFSYGGVFKKAKKELQLDDGDLLHTETEYEKIISNYITYECSWVGRKKGSNSGGYKINSEYKSDEEGSENYGGDNVDD
jgi:plasmid rolling circle replication initiator protein Rep